jgi:hypothetical protein
MMVRAIAKKKEVIALNYEVPTTSHKPHTLWTRYTTEKVPGKIRSALCDFLILGK